MTETAPTAVTAAARRPGAASAPLSRPVHRRRRLPGPTAVSSPAPEASRPRRDVGAPAPGHDPKPDVLASRQEQEAAAGGRPTQRQQSAASVDRACGVTVRARRSRGAAPGRFVEAVAMSLPAASSQLGVQPGDGRTSHAPCAADGRSLSRCSRRAPIHDHEGDPEPGEGQAQRSPHQVRRTGRDPRPDPGRVRPCRTACRTVAAASASGSSRRAGPAVGEPEPHVDVLPGGCRTCCIAAVRTAAPVRSVGERQTGHDSVTAPARQAQPATARRPVADRRGGRRKCQHRQGIGRGVVAAEGERQRQSAGSSTQSGPLTSPGPARSAASTIVYA